MKQRKSFKPLFLIFWSQNIQVIFFESVFTSLSTEILISKGGSTFSIWSLFSYKVDGTSSFNSGIMGGSSIMEKYDTHKIATHKYLVHTETQEQ